MTFTPPPTDSALDLQSSPTAQEEPDAQSDFAGVAPVPLGPEVQHHPDPTAHPGRTVAPDARNAGPAPTPRRRLAAYGLAAGALIGFIDLGLATGRVSAIALLSAAGLTALLGGALGALADALFALGRRLPTPARLVLWPTLFLGAGAHLSEQLGAWSRLGTKDHTLALAVLLASGVGALLAAGLALLHQPTRRRPAPLDRAGRLLRAFTGLTLCAAAVAAAVADRRLFPGGYEEAHTALRATTFALAMLGLAALSGALRPGPAPRAASTARRSPARRLATLAALLAVTGFLVTPFIALHAPEAPATRALLARPLSRFALSTVRYVADLDRDGYSALLGGGDCNDFNADISPGAWDTPGNGIDEDCRGGDATELEAPPSPLDTPVPDAPSPRSVVLITIDTLRPDRMSTYGYARETTPNLTRFAERAVRFDRAQTTGGWTSIAISTLLHGRYARHLSWTRLVETNKYRLIPLRELGDLPKGETIRTGFALPLDDPHAPIAWWLQRRGMHTIAVVDGGFSDFFAERFMGEGFDEYLPVNPKPGRGERGDARTSSLAIAAALRVPKDRPFFMWVHYFGPHLPSKSHPKLKSWGKTAGDRYDHEILFTDKQIGRLLAALDATRREDLDILITADHGEVIRNDTARDHGGTLLPATTRIPLLLRAAGLEPGTVDTPASLVDVLPTILALTETPAPPQLDGLDLRDLIDRPATAPPRVVFTDTWRIKGNGDVTWDQTAASDGVHLLGHDILNNEQRLTLLTDMGPAPPDLADDVPHAPLSRAIDQYLSRTGGAFRVTDGLGRSLIAGRAPLASTGVKGLTHLNDSAAPADGSYWNNAHAAIFEDADAWVGYDLGEPKTIACALLQGDNNDRYRVEGSIDGLNYTLLWESPPHPKPGLRTRSTRLSPAPSARYVRLRPTRGDSSFSIGEFALFATCPRPWPPGFRRVPSVRLK